LIEKLGSFIESHPESSAQAGLVMAQMHLNQGNVSAAIQVLNGEIIPIDSNPS
jgi:hypothetical protein